MRVDQGSLFTSVRWTNRAKAVGTDVQESGVEAHNSLRSGERYHALSRWILLKIRKEHLKMDNNIRLKLAVKAMNDTMGPEGLVPFYLVFGGIPRFPSTESALQTQQQRINDMQAARRELSIITVELRIPQSPLITRNKKCRPHGWSWWPCLNLRRNWQTVRSTPSIILVDGNHVLIVDNHRKVKFNKH